MIRFVHFIFFKQFAKYNNFLLQNLGTLSWNSCHRIVATGDQEIEWLQISVANCTEYLMHNAYFVKKPSKDKKRKWSTGNETGDETEDESTGLSISDNSIEVQ